MERSEVTSHFGASIAHPFGGPCMSTCPVPRSAAWALSCSRSKQMSPSKSRSYPPKTRRHSASHAENQVQVPSTKIRSVLVFSARR